MYIYVYIYLKMYRNYCKKINNSKKKDLFFHVKRTNQTDFTLEMVKPKGGQTF